MATKPKILTRDQLLASSGKQETYQIPELGGAVVLRSLTRQDQKDIGRESQVDDKTDEGLLEALMIVKSCVEPQLTTEDVGSLLGHTAGLIGRLVDSFLLTSSMTRLIRTRNDHLAAVAERAGN